jgi:hypothetical protein
MNSSGRRWAAGWQRPAVEPDCPEAGDCRFEAARAGGLEVRARRPIARLAGRNLPGPCDASRPQWRPQRSRGLAWPKGHAAGRGRVARLMRHHGIRARAPRRFRVCPTGRHHDLPVAPNRPGQNFAAGRPNQVWLGLHHLRANQGRVALSGRRARSLRPQNHRLGDARPHARRGGSGREAASAAGRPWSGPRWSIPPTRSPCRWFENPAGYRIAAG